RGTQHSPLPSDDGRVMQTGVAGEVITSSRRLDGDVGCMQADRAHVRDGRSIGQAAVADAVVQLLVSFVHQRARRPYFQIGLSNETVHDLAFVQSRGPEG